MLKGFKCTEKQKAHLYGNTNTLGKHWKVAKDKINYGENSPNWKGGKSKYYRHSFVWKNKGKASNYKCEICKTKKAEDWSNVDHKYRRNLDDYRALCRKCHRQWDKRF